MTVEAELRAIAEATTSAQRPVTAREVMATTRRREQPGDRSWRGWLLVAASAALLVGGLAVLLTGGTDSGPERLPAVSTPSSAPSTTQAPAETLVNEPTLEYQDGVEWWAPTALPEGWSYGYAVEEGATQTVRVIADDRRTLDIVVGPAADATDTLEGAPTAEDLGGESWQIAAEDERSVASRIVDGQALVIRGPADAVRVVAASLERTPERELVRPPFRPDGQPGPVVVTVPGDEQGRDAPIEVRAHTDGLYTTVGGEIKRVSAEDPLAFGEPVYESVADGSSYRVLIPGIAFARAEQLTFGLIDGTATEVPTTGSDRFAERFYTLVTEVPASVIEQFEAGRLERLTRWSFAYVDGVQRVYDEPGSRSCVNCDVDTSDVADPASPASGPLTFEPTNRSSDESWWVATEPTDLEFAYAWTAAEDGVVVQTVWYGADPVRPELGVTTRRGPASETPPAGSTEVQIGGRSWSWDGDAEYVTLWTEIDGGVLEVAGARPIAEAAAATVVEVPGAELERPPYRADLSDAIVVATLTGEAADPTLPSELRVATDGATIAFDGGTPMSLSTSEPVTVLGASWAGPAAEPTDTTQVVISGYTTPDVATLELELLDGSVVEVAPVDLSGRFGVRFFLVAVEAPAGAFDQYPAVVPSLIARDDQGRVLAALSEPI